MPIEPAQASEVLRDLLLSEPWTRKQLLELLCGMWVMLPWRWEPEYGAWRRRLLVPNQHIIHAIGADVREQNWTWPNARRDFRIDIIKRTGGYEHFDLPLLTIKEAQHKADEMLNERGFVVLQPEDMPK